MLDVWKYLKREVEKSVCWLAKIQNVLWGFAFSKIGRKSLIMCFQSYCGFTETDEYFLNCVPSKGGSALGSYSFKEKQSSHRYKEPSVTPPQRTT